MKLNKEEDIIVEGPCEIKILTGNIFIQGKEFGDIAIIGKGTFSVSTNNIAEIETNCNILAKISHLGWDEIISQIIQTEGTTIVLGSNDSGKTYFCKTFINKTKNITYLTADVGQPDIFIPTFISSKIFPENSIFNYTEFYGYTSPSYNPRLHVEQTSKIYEKTKSKINVIDTDGWVRGLKAYMHKKELIYYINPDYILLFDERLKNDLPSMFQNRIVIVNKIPRFLFKNKLERIRSRREKFIKYFRDSHILEVNYTDVFGSRLNHNLSTAWGDMLQFEYGECYGYFIDKSIIKGALVALLNSGKISGAGIIRNINEKIEILTPEKKADGVILGSISLNDNFEERSLRLLKCY
ncbi:Clp1/GlmU family protein [Acidianus brierleyi]|uniref:polynucleotide 5'-hydroxyl-kinase n=1 Tax=Acidianus brierleyi TaxID=41673 RepID=A0A2U9IEY9_9CREN|nr:Clp1/GlmU family protein [Acidianus brierleyi]AWR94591.1 hypothetical protein DFR85_08290 [Acidianus brierleyi]